jgi:CDP-diacylglycerol--glycerol-3-phosphate 3-phosphatidyltransferase
MGPVLWVLAVLSTITVIHRIRYTYVQSTAREAAARQAAPV